MSFELRFLVGYVLAQLAVLYALSELVVVWMVGTFGVTLWVFSACVEAVDRRKERGNGPEEKD